MDKLKSDVIRSSCGYFDVNVFDGIDVEYSKTRETRNYKYFYKDGVRHKTRPYAQYTAMTNRCLEGGSHQERYESYVGVSNEFKDFDDWMDWALLQDGFMCLDNQGKIYQIDKDLLGSGKLYSKNNCCFIPQELNSYIINKNRTLKLKYIDRGVGFEIQKSNRVFDYKYLDVVCYVSCVQGIKTILEKYFDSISDVVIDEILEIINKATIETEECCTLSGKVLCLDYDFSVNSILKRNFSLDECLGVSLEYKGSLYYSYHLNGYDWVKAIFDVKKIKFSNNLNLEVYSLLLRILVTEWYIKNEVLSKVGKEELIESMLVMIDFLSKYKKYQLDSIVDYGGIGEFIDSTIKNIKLKYGGVVTGGFLKNSHFYLENFSV